jgi:hypothetical protein
MYSSKYIDRVALFLMTGISPCKCMSPHQLAVAPTTYVHFIHAFTLTPACFHVSCMSTFLTHAFSGCSLVVYACNNQELVYA